MIAKRWLNLLGLLGLIASCPAVAQDYPSHVVTIVVPNAPGGPSDLFARWIGNLMSRELGQQIIVENVGGASGTIGASRVAQAAPDGYTLLMHNITFAAAPALYKSRTYDPLKDFDPIVKSNGILAIIVVLCAIKLTGPSAALKPSVARARRIGVFIGISFFCLPTCCSRGLHLWRRQSAHQGAIAANRRFSSRYD